MLQRGLKKKRNKTVESAAFVQIEKKNFNQTEAVLQMKLICLQFMKRLVQAPAPLHIFFSADICRMGFIPAEPLGVGLVPLLEG